MWSGLIRCLRCAAVDLPNRPASLAVTAIHRTLVRDLMIILFSISWWSMLSAMSSPQTWDRVALPTVRDGWNCLKIDGSFLSDLSAMRTAILTTRESRRPLRLIPLLDPID